MLSDHRLSPVALLFDVLPFDGASSLSASTPDLRMLATRRCKVVVDDLISCAGESTRVRRASSRVDAWVGACVWHSRGYRASFDKTKQTLRVERASLGSMPWTRMPSMALSSAPRSSPASIAFPSLVSARWPTVRSGTHMHLSTPPRRRSPPRRLPGATGKPAHLPRRLSRQKACGPPLSTIAEAQRG